MVVSIDKQRELLLAAARTVTKRTPRKRRMFIAERLDRLAKDYDPEIAAVTYYLRLGTVPESLWTE